VSSTWSTIGGLYLDVDPSMFGSMGEADTAADVSHEALARTRKDVDWEAREQERRGEICLGAGGR
jgi:hypothetical protein